MLAELIRRKVSGTVTPAAMAIVTSLQMARMALECEK